MVNSVVSNNQSLPEVQNTLPGWHSDRNPERERIDCFTTTEAITALCRLDDALRWVINLETMNEFRTSWPTRGRSRSQAGGRRSRRRPRGRGCTSHSGFAGEALSSPSPPVCSACFDSVMPGLHKPAWQAQRVHLGGPNPCLVITIAGNNIFRHVFVLHTTPLQCIPEIDTARVLFNKS